MHTLSPAPYAIARVNDGDMLAVGNLRLQFFHTPGHTRDSTCIRVDDRLFTGDTLLIGGTGRTDLPTGDADALYDSLFNGILKLDPDAEGLSRARLQEPQARRRSRARSPRTRACRRRDRDELRRHDAAAEHRGTDASHRSAAHEHDGRQDRCAAA